MNVRVLRMSMLPVSHNGSPGALALSIANPGRLVMPTPSGSASSAAPAPAPLAPVPNVHLQPPVQTSAAPFWNLPNWLPIMFRHFQVQPTFNLNPLPTYSFANRTWSASPPWAVQGQPITINVVIAPRDPPNSDRIFRSEAHGEGFVGISNATAPSGENVSQLAIGGNVADLLIFSIFHFGFFHQATLSFSTMSNTLSFGTNGGISLAANFFDGAI